MNSCPIKAIQNNDTNENLDPNDLVPIYIRNGKNNVVACQSKMARCCSPIPLAICNENVCTYHEPYTRWGRLQLLYWKNFMSRTASEDALFSHFWMSSVWLKILGEKIGFKVKSWFILMTTSNACRLVSWVLSLETGLASPRFSVLHDDSLKL